MTTTPRFDHTNPAHQELKVWRRLGQLATRPVSWATYARSYAKLHGEAKVWRADDRVVCYWNDDGRVRQRTYPSITHVHRPLATRL